MLRIPTRLQMEASSKCSSFSAERSAANARDCQAVAAAAWPVKLRFPYEDSSMKQPRFLRRIFYGPSRALRSA